MSALFLLYYVEVYVCACVHVQGGAVVSPAVAKYQFGVYTSTGAMIAQVCVCMRHMIVYWLNIMF